jgi:hypothetical protein
MKNIKTKHQVTALLRKARNAEAPSSVAHLIRAEARRCDPCGADPCGAENYIVAIPTYKRYEQVYNKTINTLLKGKVPSSKIYLFVANKSEYNKYKENVPEKSYNSIIIGKKGITNQRNFMNNYFKEGQCVLYLDDDVEKVLILKNKQSNNLVQLTNIHNFIIKAFNKCIENNIYLWGIYPVNNAFFMRPRPTISNGLRFILGTFYGQIIRHSKDLKLTLTEKEDFQNSILHYIKDGSVLRFDKVTIKTNFYNPDGGIMAASASQGSQGRASDLEKRKNINKQSALRLKQLYPEYGDIWIRKNGIYEFRLSAPKESQR